MAEQKEIKLSPQQVVQMYNQQREQLASFQNIRNNISQNLMETLTAIESLNEIKKSERGNNIKTAVGSGVYLNLKVDSVDKVTMFFGPNSSKEMSVAKAAKKLEERKKNLDKDLENISKEELILLKNIQGIEGMLRQMQESQVRPQNQQGPAVIS